MHTTLPPGIIVPARKGQNRRNECQYLNKLILKNRPFTPQHFDNEHRGGGVGAVLVVLHPAPTRPDT